MNFKDKIECDLTIEDIEEDEEKFDKVYNDFLPLFRYLVTFVYSIYGVKTVTKWLKTNKGKNFLLFVNASDVGYATVNLVGNKVRCCCHFVFY